VLKLRRAETTSASHLYTAPVNSVTKTTISVGCQPVSKQGAHHNTPDDTSPNVNAEADGIPTLAKRLRIIPRPELILVETKYNLTRKTSFVCPQTVLYKLTKSVLM
jgi:hypothetical protein